MMEGLDLQEIRRNYYDPLNAILIPQHHLEIWPGYTTSIRQHEHTVLLCAEIDNKVLRTDTAYDQMQQMMRKFNDQNKVKREMIGSIVMTKYNRKTYRVDDIDFTKFANGESRCVLFSLRLETYWKASKRVMLSTKLSLEVKVHFWSLTLNFFQPRSP